MIADFVGEDLFDGFVAAGGGLPVGVLEGFGLEGEVETVEELLVFFVKGWRRHEFGGRGRGRRDGVGGCGG